MSDQENKSGKFSEPDAPSRMMRIEALQHWLDRVLYHPVAARLAGLLSKTPITPNMVSIAGALLVIFVGWIYVQPGWPHMALIGLALHMVWHVLDGADGDLARLTGRAGRSGEIVDGICDYLGHIILYSILAAAAADEVGNWVWLLMLAAGSSRIVQASFYESQRRKFQSWAFGVEWLGTPSSDGTKTVLGQLGKLYLGVARFAAPSDGEIEKAMRDQEQRKLLQPMVRELGPSALSGSAWLGANYRTLALGISMLAGSPLYYFVFEATVLNLVLLHGINRSRRTHQRLSREVASNPNTRR